MKNKLVAALLAFFGGSFGLHKFYLGDSGAGIFYIFLTMMTSSVFPVSVILGVIDGLRYLMMPPAEFDRKFNKRYKSQRRTPSRRRQKRTEHYQKQKRSTRRKSPSIRSNPFKKSGLKKYKEYDIEEAIEDFHKALKIDPKDVSIYFNLACAYSLMEDKEKAFKYLEMAVAHGMRDSERILSHDDLAFVRIQPEFESFRTSGFKRSGINQQKRAEGSDPQQQAPMDDILLAQLNRLMELRKKGVLTEQEFLRERKKVLTR